MMNDWRIATDRQRELIDDADRIARGRHTTDSRTRRWWQW